MLYKKLMILIYLQVPINLLGQDASNIPFVQWNTDNTHVTFEVRTPSTGCFAIGFNEVSGLQDTYLIMGRIINDKAEVNEHYVFKPGHYQSISELGQEQRAKIIDYKETDSETYVRFKIPNVPTNQYQKLLTKLKEYYLTVAYSASDDFQHHSIFRKQYHTHL